MHRDHDTLYLDYINISNIERYITHDAMSYIDALTVEVEHLHGESLRGLTKVKVSYEIEERYKELLVQLERTLRELEKA